MRHPVKGPRILSTALGVAALTLLLQIPIFAATVDDDTPPVLHSVAVSETSVYAGGTVVVSADGADDSSGIQSIGVRFQNAATGTVLTADLLTNSDEDIDLPYSGILKIPKDAPAGTYMVAGVTLTDWEDNQARYGKNGQEPLVGSMQASFTVMGEGGGSQPGPASCKVQMVSSGVSIQFAATSAGVLTDQITLLFENRENNHKLTFTLEAEDYRNGVYTKEFGISAYEPSGTFELKKVTIKDTVGNKTTYTDREDEEKLPLNISASFTIQSGRNDSEPPVLHSVAIGQPIWYDDEAKALLTVQASDNLSGIEHITVKFKHVTTGEKASKVLRNTDSKDGKTFTGYLKLKDEDARGTYQLDSVTVVDRAGNRSTYCHPDDVNDRKLALPSLPAFQLQ